MNDRKGFSCVGLIRRKHVNNNCLGLVHKEPHDSCRVHLHQASASILRHRCDVASDSVLIENNEVATHFQVTPLFSMKIVVTALTLVLGVNGPL